MSSWWRKIAEQQGTLSGSGSWKRRVALGLATPSPGQRGSWPRVLATSNLSGVVKQGTGNWTRRMTTPGGAQESSWAKALFHAGGPT